mmetsp:Transcript_27186/g.75973  ORF Transcript_27186/g.75973 Transcript_27186/m.75973 type:complete len:162 (+) Transcript_27186:100-585(+)
MEGMLDITSRQEFLVHPVISDAMPCKSCPCYLMSRLDSGIRDTHSFRRIFVANRPPIHNEYRLLGNDLRGAEGLSPPGGSLCCAYAAVSVLGELVIFVCEIGRLPDHAGAHPKDAHGLVLSLYSTNPEPVEHWSRLISNRLLSWMSSAWSIRPGRLGRKSQ